MFMTMIAAAAAATQPSPADLLDLRCIAAFSMMSSLIDKQEDKDKMVVGALYYVGKLDGRSPGLDLSAQLAALFSQPDYLSKQLRADAERCGEEMKARGAELQKIGKTMKTGS